MQCCPQADGASAAPSLCVRQSLEETHGGSNDASMSQAQLGDGAQRAVVEKGCLSRLAIRYSLRRKIGPASARISKLMTLGIHVHHSRVSCIQARAEEQKKIGADLDGSA